MKLLAFLIVLLMLAALIGDYTGGLHWSLSAPAWDWQLSGSGSGLLDLIIGAASVLLVGLVLAGCLFFISATVVLLPLMIVGTVLLAVLSPLLLPLGLLVILCWMLGGSRGTSAQG